MLVKRIGILSALLLVVVFILPLFAGGKKPQTGTRALSGYAEGSVSAALVPTQVPASPGTAGQMQTSGPDERMEIKAMIDGKVQTLSMADYIFGAVAAEMPVSFDMEAATIRTIAWLI